MTTPQPQPSRPTHACALTPACEKQIPLSKLMCPPHWALVPDAVQKAVYRAFKARHRHPDALRAARQAAINAAGKAGQA